ncbi:class IV adenylate cyclase [Candidatus Aerophobetes bacterium]|nr:class IV adenylate cyclase [Candidatus Aerophobetes bacterium]
MLEVEIKTKIRLKEIKEKLLKLGVKFIKEEEQRDTYFSHPSRDFRKTDEALRVRRINDKYFLTYKGEKVDSETKTRKEIEVETEEGILDILKELGFLIKGKVKKKRTLYIWNSLRIYLDKVEGLGEFLEVEGNSLKDKEKIFEFIKKLNIKKGSLIRKSYLEMLLEDGVYPI